MVLFNQQLKEKGSISPKVNAIARLEFELAYYEVTTQPLHYGESFIQLCANYLF